MTPEEILAQKLESIRDSIVEFKFVTEALEDRANKIESDLTECRSKVAELSNFGIRASEQLGTINKSMDAMSNDIRAVRNSVLSAILVAVIIWVSGTAFSTIYTNRNTPAVAGKTS